MPSYVLRDGKLIEKHLAPPLPIEGRRFGRAPMVISDTMPATRHMASGRYHESKSGFRRDTKSHGCVELGNDAPTNRARGNVKLPSPKADIAEAWSQLEAQR